MIFIQSGFVCRFCKGPHMSARCPYKVILFTINNKQDMYLEKKEEVKAPAPSAGPSNISGKYMPPALRRNNERSSECMIIND